MAEAIQLHGGRVERVERSDQRGIVELIARAMCKAERPVVDPDKVEWTLIPVYEARHHMVTSAGFSETREWHKRVPMALAALTTLRDAGFDVPLPHESRER